MKGLRIFAGMAVIGLMFWIAKDTAVVNLLLKKDRARSWTYIGHSGLEQDVTKSFPGLKIGIHVLEVEDASGHENPSLFRKKGESGSEAVDINSLSLLRSLFDSIETENEALQFVEKHELFSVDSALSRYGMAPETKNDPDVSVELKDAGKIFHIKRFGCLGKKVGQKNIGSEVLVLEKVSSTVEYKFEIVRQIGSCKTWGIE